jgi:bifunctional non-homologous end joining protein LigD
VARSPKASGEAPAPREQRAARKKSAVKAVGVRKKSAVKAVSVRKKSAVKAPARLAQYHQKRDFRATPEPSGLHESAAPRPERGGARDFVVQKHAASHLHYDFRLELDGVLVSWAVPKGPSLKAGEKRLAVRVEDHPLAYKDFEGVIPEGAYGGGSVIVWDRGAWQPVGDAHAGLAKGHLELSLEGAKLRGRFHLVRTRRGGTPERARAPAREQWLLFKAHDAAESSEDVTRTRPESVLSGRRVEDVARAPDAVWTRHGAEPVEPAKKARGKLRDADAQAAATPGQRSGARREADVLALVKGFSFGVPLTNLDKLLYPEAGIRKAELIAYYACVAEVMLPHLGGRPLTVVRCPNGPAKHCFFQKHANTTVPRVVRRVAIRDQDGKEEPYMAADDARALIALGQLGALELHTWGSHTDAVERPDVMVFDLDPDEGLPWQRVVDAALELRARLTALGLRSFVKTTGGKGLHVTVPLRRGLDWDAHHAVAEAIARRMAEAAPDRYVTSMRKSLRTGKIFLDYLRNGRGATFVAPYSPRARTGATVATPVSWEELGAGLDPTSFDLRSVVARLERSAADPWHDYFEVDQAIGRAQLTALIRGA